MSAVPDLPEGHVRIPAGRTRPTRRALVQLILGLVLYGAGANVSAAWVIVLAALTLGALPWAFVTARRAARSVSARRVLPATTTAGMPALVTLELRARTTAMAVVEDELTGAVGVAGGLREGAVLEATVRLARGRPVGGRVRVTLTDALGLVTVVAEGDVPAEGEALPAVPRIRGLADRHARAIDRVGRGVRTGAGVEVTGVREYAVGDRLHAVHWRSSARRGELVVRELTDDARPRLRVELAAGAWPVAALDRACEVASGVADGAHRTGLDVTLAVDGVRVPWSPAVRRLLAQLPPHAGAPERPLAEPAPGVADVTVGLRPSEAGLAVSVTTEGVTDRWAVVPSDASVAEVEAWLDGPGGRS